MSPDELEELIRRCRRCGVVRGVIALPGRDIRLDVWPLVQIDSGPTFLAPRLVAMN